MPIGALADAIEDFFEMLGGNRQDVRVELEVPLPFRWDLVQHPPPQVVPTVDVTALGEQVTSLSSTDSRLDHDDRTAPIDEVERAREDALDLALDIDLQDPETVAFEPLGMLIDDGRERADRNLDACGVLTISGLEQEVLGVAVGRESCAPLVVTECHPLDLHLTRKAAPAGVPLEGGGCGFGWFALPVAAVTDPSALHGGQAKTAPSTSIS